MWREIPFEKCIQKTTISFRLPKKNYLASGKFPVVSQEKIMVSGYHNDPSHVFKISKPVVVFGDHTQVLKYVDFDFVVGADGVKILLPNNNLDSKYFYYLLMLKMPNGKGYARHFKLLKNLYFPIPPLEEQQRIVSKLDAIFAEIDIKISNLTKKNLKTNQLVNRLISSIFNQLNENELTTSTLGEVTYRAGRIGWKGLTKKEYVNKGRLFLSVHGLNYGKYVDFRDAFRITQARYDESPEIMLKKGDILLCKDGAGIGKLAIVPELPEPATINGSLLLIRPLKHITPDYIYYSLLSEEFQKIIQSQIDGSTTPHLYQKDITLFPFSYPRLNIQKEITEKISSALSDLEKLQNYSKKNIENLNVLKSAILSEELQIKVA